MCKVTVVDSIMGSGKTSWAIEYMNKTFGENARRIIYVTPYIDEIKRVKQNTNKNFKEPDKKKGKGSKLNHFKKLLEAGENIITTHALFGLFDEDVMILLKNYNYILILDEVFNVIDDISMGKDDVKILKEHYIEVEPNGKVNWIYEGVYDGRYKDIKNLAENETLYTYGEGNFYYWCFPAKIFDLFYKTYILTYQFEYQIQRYYYDLFNVEYEYKSVAKIEGKYTLVDYAKDLEAIAHLKSLITIYEGKMNTNYFGKKSKYNNELSSSWLKNASDVQFNQLKKNLENFFRKVCKAKQNEILWSCYKKFVSNLKGKGYTKAWLEYNARATNNYKDRTALAYVCNVYMNPNEVQFFSSYDIQIDQDGLALSTMLQWIWRSAIRDDKSIQIYIPSQRMRELLKQYLDGEK